MRGIILLNLIVLPLVPLAAHATPAITCHCFTDRSYDPSRPALADPYFLATTQNSFFAALYKVDKKSIVMKKQGGSSADDIWVAYWVASKSGLTAEALLAQRERNVAWKEVIVSLGLPARSFGERIATEITAGASTARLARIMADDVLIQNRLLGAQEVALLRKEQASNQEVIITALMATKLGRPPTRIYGEAKSGAKSWGMLLAEAKIQPAGIQAEFSKLLK